MSSFTNPLIVKKVGRREWELHTPFEFRVGSKYSSDVIQVPKGFRTDFASVPRIFWTIVPPDGRWTGAAVVHDWLYTVKTRSRKACDDVFLEAMTVLGVTWWKRHAMYRAVRIFGGLSWQKRPTPPPEADVRPRKPGQSG